MSKLGIFLFMLVFSGSAVAQLLPGDPSDTPITKIENADLVCVSQGAMISASN